MTIAYPRVSVDRDPCHSALLTEPKVLRQNAAVRILCPFEIRILDPVEHVRLDERAPHASAVDLYFVLSTFPHSLDFLAGVLVNVIERTEPAHGRKPSVYVVPCPVGREPKAYILRIVKEVPDRIARDHDVAVDHQDVVCLFCDSLLRDPVPCGRAVVACDVIKHHPVATSVKAVYGLECGWADVLKGWYCNKDLHVCPPTM